MKSMVDGLAFSTNDAIARLVLDRPDKKNAVNQAMWEEIARIVETLGRSGGTRVLILSGHGVDFCAGADISEFDTVRKDAATARTYEAANSRAFRALREAPFPVIAAISGICFGGGFGLASACDLRIATPDARFAVPAGRLGLAYPQDAMADIVTERAARAFDAGAHGVIASPHEAARIRALPNAADRLIVTPGVRPAGSDAGDQKRIETPATAIANGADHIVVGRPIWQAEDPRAAALAIQAELAAL